MNNEKKMNRIYFLQDLKNVLEKHNALIEVENDGGYVSLLFDLENKDQNLRQVGNVIGGIGEYSSYDLDLAIKAELDPIT